MRLLVTGASGHIGGAIARGLAARGHEVVGLSRHAAEGLPASIEYVCADIGMAEFTQRVSDAVPACVGIVHAAACLSTRADDPETSRVNCLGTQQVLALADAWKCVHFVFISGLNVYGVPNAGPLTEEHPLDPLTDYAASKLSGERLVSAASSRAMTATSLRVASPVGPGLRKRRIFSIFVEQALAGEPLTVDGRGARLQSYVDVRDVAAAVEAALLHSKGGVFNVGAKKAVSNLELAEACVRVLGGEGAKIIFSGKAESDGGISWDVSSQKAATKLGYAPAHDIEDSIRALAQEKRAHVTPR